MTDYVLVPEHGLAGQTVSFDIPLPNAEVLSVLTGIPFYECCGKYWQYSAWLDHRDWRHGWR